jgi:hypothetical protein
MNRLAQSALLLILGLPALVMAQSNPPDFDNWTPPAIGAESEAIPDEKPRSGWLLNSPLVRMRWPEVQMPAVEVPPLVRNTENGEPGLLMRPVVRAQTASRAAATRTRDAWNGTVDRMKLRLPEGNQSASTSTNQPRQRFWSSWFAAEPSAAPIDEPSSVPELMAREPGERVR